MKSSHTSHRRKAAWLAFAVVAFAVCCPVVYAGSSGEAENSLQNSDKQSSQTSLETKGEEKAVSSIDGDEQYKKALDLLATLPSARTLQKAAADSNRPKSLLASLFPNHEGPIATAIRILARIEQELSFLPIRVFKSFNFRKPNPNVREKASTQATLALSLLEEASEKGHLEALYTLGMSSMFPPPGASLNATKAYYAFEQHATLTGNSTSQSLVAFIYSTGLQGAVPVDQAKALLWYTFAGLGGDQHAEMALGYRYFLGVGVTEDCMQALDWYETAADKSMAHFQAGPPGGRTLPPTPLKLTDLAGGVFGYGASAASSGIMANRPVIKAAQALKTGERWEEVIEYWRFHADRGDMEAAYRLGKIYYHGGMYNTPGGISSGVEGVATVPRDFTQSRMYFLKVARQVWPRDNPAKPHTSKMEDVEQSDRYFALLSAHFLGRMHLRGEGVRQDIKIAKMWFERAAKEGDRESLNALGIISRDGLLDGKSKEDDAVVQFGRAAAQDLAEAILNLGKLYYRKGNMVLARTYFENAIRHGSQFEAYYYAATIHAHAARTNPGQGGSCAAAVSYYKTVAERGCWKNNVVAEAEKYWNSPDPSLREGAIVRWQIAADRGVEVAQNNLAYVLEEVVKSHHRPGISSDNGLTEDFNRTARDALMYWTRSAAQGDLDAMVKLGDLHYHGIGVDEPSTLRHEKAAGYYHAAIDSFSTIAMWNVGWMYENGIGSQQDFHLAKRYYDMALETNHHAYFPIVLSLIKLHLRSLWYIMRGGKQQNLILWGDDAENEGWWPKLWRSDQGGSGTGGSSRPKVVDIDDEDPIKRARDIRDAAVGIGGDDEDAGEDYFDGMTRRRGGGAGGGGGLNGDGMGDGEFEEWEDDWELVLLAGLAVTIGVLVMLRRYYEQRRQEAIERRRREQRAAEQQEEQNHHQQHQQPRGPQLHHQQVVGDRPPEMNPPPPPPMPGAGLDDPLLQNMAIFM